MMTIFSSQKNRNFSTLDLFMLVALVGGVGSVFGVVLAQAFQDERPMRARMSAENLARQIEARQTESAKVQNNRSPASVDSNELSAAPVLTDGSLGKDPWGHPFHYAVRSPKVFVWSDGPNGRDETQLGTTMVLGGDDVGSSRSLQASH